MRLLGASSTFRSLRIRNFRLYAAGQVVSNSGTWMQRVAQDWLVLHLTGSGTALGITTGLQFLPLLLLGLWGGGLADRYPRRRLLGLTQGSMGALAAGLGILDLAGVVTVWHVYLLALLLGVATAVDNPTRQSFVVELVGREDLPNAVALNGAVFNLGRLVGPAIAGLLITAIGTGWVFVANALSYGVVVACLGAMRPGELKPQPRVERARGQIRAGLSYVWGRADLMAVIVVIGFAGMFGFNQQVTTALFATQVFHSGAASFGLLSTALAVGSLFGALIAARRKTLRLRMVIASAAVFGLLEVLGGVMPTYGLYAAVLVPTGLAALTLTTAANALMQIGVDPAMRGRVMGLYMLVFLGTTPIGSPVIGWIGQHFGARWTLLVGGGVTAVAALVAAVVLARRMSAPVDGAEVDVAPRPAARLLRRAVPGRLVRLDRPAVLPAPAEAPSAESLPAECLPGESLPAGSPQAGPVAVEMAVCSRSGREPRV